MIHFMAKKVQKITETLPPVTITETSQIRVTETPQPIISTSYISQTITADALTVIQTSIEVHFKLKTILTTTLKTAFFKKALIDF